MPKKTSFMFPKARHSRRKQASILRKAISTIIAVVILLLILVSLAAILYVFSSGLVGTTITAGTEQASQVTKQLSSCMRIDNINGNRIDLKNCGKGVIENKSLVVMMDDAKLVSSADTIEEDSSGTVNVSELYRVSSGRHTLRISNGAAVAQAIVDVQVNSNGLAGSWSFDEGSGAIAHDNSSNRNDGAISLGAGGNTNLASAWVEGKVGKALSFDGVDDYAEVPDSYSLNITGAITIEAWVSPEIATLSANNTTIMVNGSSSELRNYSVKVSVPYDTGMRSDYADLRFVDVNGKKLDYWIEGYNSSYADAWVKVPVIPVSGTVVYIKYGNASAAYEGKLWDNVRHLGVYGGVFDYNAFYGVNQSNSREMQHRQSIAPGAFHTCVLKSNGNVDCYGYNNYGQAANYTGGDARSIATTDVHSCILKSGGNVDCYGNDPNRYGILNDYSGGNAAGISASFDHNCALKPDGNVDCWGSNTNGQSNDYNGGDAIGVSNGLYYTCVLKSNGNVDCWGFNNYGQANDYNGGDAIGVYAGYYHTCILKSNGNVDCYGRNVDGRANDYNGGDAIGVYAGARHTCVLKSDGNVGCYGYNGYGETNGYTGGDAIGVYAGPGQTCVLKSNGNADCYGYNNYGQANDYMNGDAMNPFRKYASPEPSAGFGSATKATGVDAVSKGGSYAIGATGSSIFGSINGQQVSAANPAGWSRITLNYDGVMQNLFVNGNLAASNPLAGNINTNTNNLLIGNAFKGVIDEVRMWNNALAPDETVIMKQIL